MPNHNEALSAYIQPFAQERLLICRQCEFYSATLCKKENTVAKNLYLNPDFKCPIDKWDIVVFE